MFSWVLLPTSYTHHRERSFHTLREIEGLFVAAVLQTRMEGAHVGKRAIFYYWIAGNPRIIDQTGFWDRYREVRFSPAIGRSLLARL
jgi:hypothetical protein